MRSFKAPKTQCLEASHPRRPFTLDAQTHFPALPDEHSALAAQFRYVIVRPIVRGLNVYCRSSDGALPG
jgi:hypothetical protein